MQVVDIYCRVSGDPQEENTSLDEQERASREYCAAHGLTVGMVHHEVHSGFYYRERAKLSLVRQRVRDGLIQGIVVRTIDRFVRKQVHAAILLEELEHHKCQLYSVIETEADDSIIGQFVRNTLAFFAEIEREKIIDRTLTGRLNTAKAGKIASGKKAPYGWDWVRDELGKISRIVINTPQAGVLRRAAELYADGVSAAAIVDQLNSEGIPSPDGIHAWTGQTLVALICDPRISGRGRIFAYQRMSRKVQRRFEPLELPEGTYPPIISEELYGRLLERSNANKAWARRANAEPELYLLRAGFVRCGYCKHPMVATKNRHKYIYKCSHGIGHHMNNVLSDKLDAAIWQWLEQLADHFDLIEQAVHLATLLPDDEPDTDAIDRSIATWKSRADQYLEDLRDGTLIGDTRKAIRNELNNANKVIARLEGEKIQLTAGMIDREKELAAYEDILAWCKKVKTSREELTYQQKRDFLRLIGADVIVENKRPFYEHTLYHVEIRLPAIQELLSPVNQRYCESSFVFDHSQYFIGIGPQGFYINPKLLAMKQGVA